MKRSIIVVGTLALLSLVNTAFAEESKMTVATADAVKLGTQVGADVWGKAKEYAGALETLTKEYAPEVVNAGLMVVRINGIQSLLTGFLGVLWLAAVMAIFFWRWVPHTSTWTNEDDRVFGITMGAAVALVVSVPGLILSTRLAVWNWVAVFEPKLWLAKAVFAKLF